MWLRRWRPKARRNLILRSYRKPIYAKAGEVRRVRALLFTKVTSGEHTAHRKKTREQATNASNED